MHAGDAHANAKTVARALYHKPWPTAWPTPARRSFRPSASDDSAWTPTAPTSPSKYFLYGEAYANTNNANKCICCMTVKPYYEGDEMDWMTNWNTISPSNYDMYTYDCDASRDAENEQGVVGAYHDDCPGYEPCSVPDPQVCDSDCLFDAHEIKGYLWGPTALALKDLNGDCQGGKRGLQCHFNL